MQTVAETGPRFWLNGSPDINEGSELNGALTLTHNRLERREPGFWNETDGAFGSAEGAQAGAAIKGSDSTSLACSPEGAVAILFRTPSEFHATSSAEPDGLFSRGSFGTDVPFEVNISSGKLRFYFREDGSPRKTKDLLPLDPGTWYWLGMDWKVEDAKTTINWRAYAPKAGDMMLQGSLTTQGLGTAKSPLWIAGRSVRATLGDGVISQLIIWDVPLNESGWLKLENLLK